MAKATKIEISPIPQRVPFKVTLELDMNEAIMLRSAFRKVGGSPDPGTGRYYIDQIQKALREAGVPYIKNVSNFITEGMYIGDWKLADQELED